MHQADVFDVALHLFSAAFFNMTLQVKNRPLRSALFRYDVVLSSVAESLKSNVLT